VEIVLILVAALLGLLAGGVINALADDLPHDRSPRLPHYPDGTPRPRAAWLGVLAFLTGQRAAPRAPDDPPDAPPSRLGWRHPLVEIGLALAYSAMVLGFRDEANLPIWMFYVALLLLITIIDLEHRLIPFEVIVVGCAFALVVAAVSPEGGKPFLDFVIGGAVGFLVFYLMYAGGQLFMRVAGVEETAFGFGDVLLATLSGLMLGWRSFIFAALITVFVGALGALLYIVARALSRSEYRMFTPLPYGPYIVIGTLVMLLFREDVRAFLQGG